MVFSYIAFFRVVLHFLCLYPTPVSRQNHRTITENETSAQKYSEFAFFFFWRCSNWLSVAVCVVLYSLSTYNAYFSSVATLVLDTLKIQTPFVSVCGSGHCHVRNNELAVRQIMCEVGHVLSRATTITVMRPRAQSK